MTPGAQQLADQVASLAQELLDEQLSWARDTIRAVVNLAGAAPSMRVADIRRALREIVAEDRAAF